MLHAYWLPKRKDWFVCISWMITSDQHIYEYCHRWGIETSYRLLKSISFSTTTNHPSVRFLYLCFPISSSLYMSIFVLLLFLLFSLPRLTNLFLNAQDLLRSISPYGSYIRVSMKMRWFRSYCGSTNFLNKSNFLTSQFDLKKNIF